MNNISIQKFIKKSPKAELHLHIEGTLEPELMFSLAKRNNIEIPFKSIDDINKAYNFSTLDSFLKIYYDGAQVLIKEQDFVITDSQLSKAKDNLELFYDDSIFIDQITQEYAKEIAYIVQGQIRFYQQAKNNEKK